MSKLESLKKQALKASKFRGHKMSAWTDGRNCETSILECRICKAYVQVDVNPPANGIDIGGSAVAVGCEDCEQRIYKTFKDCYPGGKPVKLEAKLIGKYIDDKNKVWLAWYPVNSSWFGLYHLEAETSKATRMIVIGLSTTGMEESEWRRKYIIPID